MNSFRLDEAGLHFLANAEGKRNSKYKDSAGYWTIGIGHLIKKGESFPDTMTDKEVYDLFKNDIKGFEDSVNKIVKIPLNQKQFNALVSFTFNLGIGAFSGSTLLRKLNSNDVAGAANEFLKWNKAGGEVIQGLVFRRQRERELFLSSPIPDTDIPDNIKNDDISGHWAAVSINNLIKLGYMSTDKNGYFYPDKPVTRAEIAVIVSKILKER